MTELQTQAVVGIAIICLLSGFVIGWCAAMISALRQVDRVGKRNRPKYGDEGP